MENLDIFYIENVKFQGESEKRMIRWIMTTKSGLKCGVRSQSVTG